MRVATLSTWARRGESAEREKESSLAVSEIACWALRRWALLMTALVWRRTEAKLLISVCCLLRWNLSLRSRVRDMSWSRSSLRRREASWRSLSCCSRDVSKLTFFDERLRSCWSRSCWVRRIESCFDWRVRAADEDWSEDSWEVKRVGRTLERGTTRFEVSESLVPAEMTPMRVGWVERSLELVPNTGVPEYPGEIGRFAEMKPEERSVNLSVIAI